MIYLLFLIVGPIIVGLLLYITRAKQACYVALFVQTAMLCTTIISYSYIKTGQQAVFLLSPYRVPVGMSLRLDYLAFAMILLSNFVFLCATLYNIKRTYMNAHFVFLYLSFQGLINGVFLSNDLFNIYLLIEIATVVVSVLIMYKKDGQSMYDGMLYLVINMTAMTFFLMGIGYIYKHFGLFDFAGIRRLVPLVSDYKVLILPYAFLMTGVSLKSAIMPVFSWLPKAHGTASAPSIVSAILSGVFVKTGIYMMIRLSQVFGGALDIQHFLLAAGLITAILGFVFAIAQIDIKLILAYHTISQVGLMLIGIFSGTQSGYQGAVYHIVAHGIFKSLLFIIAGILIRRFHTRDIKQMRGLWRADKLTSVCLLIAIASITGAPFFSGGYSKALIQYNSSEMVYFFLLLINLGTMVSFVKFFGVLSGAPTQALVASRKLYLNEKVALIVMALACLALGLFGTAFGPLIGVAKYVISTEKQLLKVPTYLMTAGLGYLVYYYGLKKHPILDKLRRLDISFNQAIHSILVYFIALIIYFYSLYA